MQSIGLKSKKILGISVTTSPKKEILEEIQKYLEKSPDKPLVITTPNPEQIVLAKRDPLFAKILNQADVSLPDGIGLAFVIKQKRIPGVEFMEDLVKLAAKRGYPIGLIGGRGKIAVKAFECLSRRAGLKGWAVEPEEKTIEEITRKIVDSHTRLVFVGLGAPKQEEFIVRLALSLREKPLAVIARNEVTKQSLTSNGIATSSRLGGGTPRNDNVVFMSVGGSFDMIAGRTPRAPRAVQAFGLEWLWRLVREPWRWKRQVALVQFLWLVARDRSRV